MRDFERLEALSSTVRSGLEANGVIWAIDQALLGSDLEEEEKRSLEEGRDILRALADPELPAPSQSQRKAQKMLGAESAPNVRQMVVLATKLDEDEEKASVILTELASALDTVREGGKAEPLSDKLEQAIEIFSTISEVKLGQANGIANARRERASWLPQTPISTSS